MPSRLAHLIPNLVGSPHSRVLRRIVDGNSGRSCTRISRVFGCRSHSDEDVAAMGSDKARARRRTDRV